MRRLRRCAGEWGFWYVRRRSWRGRRGRGFRAGRCLWLTWLLKLGRGRSWSLGGRLVGRRWGGRAGVGRRSCEMWNWESRAGLYIREYLCPCKYLWQSLAHISCLKFHPFTSKSSISAPQPPRRIKTPHYVPGENTPISCHQGQMRLEFSRTIRVIPATMSKKISYIKEEEEAHLA